MRRRRGEYCRSVAVDGQRREEPHAIDLGLRLELESPCGEVGVEAVPKGHTRRVEQQGVRTEILGVDDVVGRQGV